MKNEVLKKLKELYPDNFIHFELTNHGYCYYNLSCSKYCPEDLRILLKAANKYYELVALND